MVKKNTIPDGWRNVSPVGQPIPGTRFIAFKVPLKGAINHRLTPTQKFTPKDLIAAVKALNVELGLIIDLTYTTRYYDVKDLPKSMEYKKLFTVGLEVPDDPTILQFKKWVRKFLWENAENDKLIGVHCTNGINRTGYLICRYLIDVEGWDPETAIQAFGEARGHHMDGNIYLTDLKTQPMRSNLGMNLWDADGDTVSPANDIDGHIDRLPNEEFSRPGKRLRVYDSDHSDFPEQIRLREFDFINKGPGHPRRPYHDHEFQDDLQPLISMRQRHFPSHPFYNGYQEEMQWKDLDFAPRTSGERLRPFQDRQLCEDIPESAPSEEIINMGRGQRQRNFPAILPHSDMLTDSQVNRGHGQRRRPFYDQKSNDEFQPHMQLKDLAYLNKRPVQQMRPFQDSPTHENMQPPMGDFEFVSRGHGQRMLDHPHHSESQRDMPLEDFDDRDSESRCRSFQDHQSYSDFNEQPELNDFLNRVPKQRIMAFNDHLTNDNVPHEGYLERGHPFLSCEHFPESSKVRKDYGSDNGYNINCRPDYLDDYKRIHPSDEVNREGKSRFAPYPSHTPYPSSIHQETNSVSVDHEREPQREIAREMGQGKRLPVVTIDYNYGLPLDYASEEEHRIYYDLHSRERYRWK